jgi:hypothetical protein
MKSTEDRVFLFKSVSSDEIRSQETQKKLREFPTMTHDKAFENARKPTNQIYDKTLKKIIQDSILMKSNETLLVFLDKNHPINGGIENAVKLIDENMPSGVLFCKVYLIPEIKNDTIKGYPFSYQFLTHCLFSGLHRENHATLDN